jgi:hypothetical protein
LRLTSRRELRAAALAELSSSSPLLLLLVLLLLLLLLSGRRGATCQNTSIVPGVGERSAQRRDVVLRAVA